MKKTLLSAAILASTASLSSAQSRSLPEYLADLNLTSVSFSGHIKYDKSSLSDVDYVCYDSEGNPFPVSLDAGRQARMDIEEQCEISGSGTVEIRGSRIYLSIDEVERLSSP
ncbi:MAG: hypothetical protein GQ535_15675 [Rhodobacteraceae bacterium]|nr:hypothetical protein [Paracoccaceae bacterium]